MTGRRPYNKQEKQRIKDAINQTLSMKGPSFEAAKLLNNTGLMRTDGKPWKSINVSQFKASWMTRRKRVTRPKTVSATETSKKSDLKSLLKEIMTSPAISADQRDKILSVVLS